MAVPLIVALPLAGFVKAGAVLVLPLPMVIVRPEKPVPFAFVALIVALTVPAVGLLPLITPVDVLIVRPLLRPVAA